METRGWFALLMLGGCFSSSTDGGGRLVGDWFICEDASCTEMDDDGLRFFADGRWAGLDADGPVEGDIAMCVEIEFDRGGQYEVSNATLRVFNEREGEEMSFQFELDGDRLTLRGVSANSSDGPSEARDVVLRRIAVVEEATAECDNSAPPAQPDLSASGASSP